MIDVNDLPRNSSTITSTLIKFIQKLKDLIKLPFRQNPPSYDPLDPDAVGLNFCIDCRYEIKRVFKGLHCVCNSHER